MPPSTPPESKFHKANFKGRNHANSKRPEKHAGKGFLAKRLAKEIVFGNHTSLGQAQRAAGYSASYVAHRGKRIMQGKDVQAELAALGFTEDMAKKRVADIMNSPVVYEMITPDNQLRAADMAFKVFGTYAPDKHLNLSVTAASTLTDEELARLAYQEPRQNS